MWLINTETLKLESVVNPETVKYGILSHTWEEEEVSFQEFQDLEFARTRKGFAKIEMTCYFAKSQGFPYAWIDTCCIDKSSSAELSEAINSMFRWYKNAQYCYAYLSDYHQTAVDSSFRRCRWFTRGWTLQELIAPRFLTFYNRDWRSLGSKIELHEVISKITRINTNVLLGQRDVKTIDVVFRMSWAAGRETTRAEDIAYCLFGIFDVNLPMLYGEGEKAFLRLQEEICQRVDDLSLFAWKTDTDEGVGRGIFAPSPDEFAYASSGDYYGEVTIADVRVSSRGVIFDDMELEIIEGKGLFLPLNFITTMPGPVYNRGGIFLEKTRYGYARIKTDQLFPAGPLRRSLAPEQISVIPWGIWTTEDTSYSIYLSTSNGITIRNVCPRRNWDPYKEAFINLWNSMAELDVNLEGGRAFTLLALFHFNFGDPFNLRHDIVDSKWESWSDALANIGQAVVHRSWELELVHHFSNRAQNQRGEGKWVYRTPMPLVLVLVNIENTERGWEVNLSLSDGHRSRRSLVRR